MEKCIKCGGMLPAGAKVCPYCGNPVSLYEEKKQPGLPLSSDISPMAPVQSASRKQARGRTILILAVVVLSGLLILSFAFAIILWSAPPKLAVSPGSLDYGTLQVGSQGSQILTLSNSGRQDLDWRVDKGKADWLTLDPSQGRIPSGGSQTINVRADTTLLTAGQYSASISFISNGGEASVSAILMVASGPESPSGPVVSSISPTSGPATGGTTVTIIGSGFTGASKVLFGTATSTFTVNSATQITVVSPAGSGTVHVTVTTPGGPSATSSADQFTYLVVPKIMSISPTSGPAAGGTTVTIRGEGLTGANKVLFGTVPAKSFTVNSATQITALSPAGSGTVDVTVTTPGGPSATSTADQFTYVYVPAPAPVPFIKSISPTLGPVTGGTKVTITGTDLTGANKVLFGTVPAKSFTRVSATQVTAVSPAGSGTVDVRVTTPGGTSETSNADRFTYVYVPAPVPFIKSISPTLGPVTGGTKVTITGTGFTGASKVLFGTVPARITSVSDIQITAVSPGGSGTVDVRVTTPGGTSAITGADQFTYVFAQPKITSISPTSGSTTGGMSVTITGSDFTGASKVLFGTVPASRFTVNSDIQITAISPGGSGTVHVRVTTPGGTSATSTADQFTYVPAPIVTGVSPKTGPAAGGTTVIITGTGFTGAGVLFGTVPARITSVSDIQITAVSPGGSGTVDVRVITPGGTSAITGADQFTYVFAQPKITSISPTSGSTTGGMSVTITGSDFTGASKVLFGTVPASRFTVNSDIQITAISPGGSGTVHVRVTTPGGTSATSTADQFTYVPAPIVTGVSPSTGPTTGGTKVTITGSGFTTAIQVKFGNVAASSPTLVSDKQIKVDSPVVTGSGTVDVRVTTPGGTSATSSADQFTYYEAAKIAVAPNSLDFGELVQGTTKTLPVTVSNTGGQALTWNLDTTSLPGWLSVNRNAGTVGAGSSLTIKVTAKTAGLAAGSQPEATLNFTSNGGSEQVLVKLIVNAPPSAAKIAVAPNSLDFGELVQGTTKTLPVTVSNTGGQALTWNLDTTSLPGWLSVNRNAGTVGVGSSLTIKVTAKTAGLSAGSQPEATLNFTSNGGSEQVTVKIKVK